MIIASLKSSLSQSQRLADMYREQVIGLEDELARIREENDIGKDIFQGRTEKMTKRLQLMNQRYEALEKRRSLEVEGFKNDIKMLRSKLKEVEKQLFKVIFHQVLNQINSLFHLFSVKLIAATYFSCTKNIVNIFILIKIY